MHYTSITIFGMDAAFEEMLKANYNVTACIRQSCAMRSSTSGLVASNRDVANCMDEFSSGMPADRIVAQEQCLLDVAMLLEGAGKLLCRAF